MDPCNSIEHSTIEHWGLAAAEDPVNQGQPNIDNWGRGGSGGEGAFLDWPD